MCECFNSPDREWADDPLPFRAFAEHHDALHHATQANGASIKRAILESTCIAKFYTTHRCEFVRASIPFMQTEAWIRHDEHYHIDVDVS